MSAADGNGRPARGGPLAGLRVLELAGIGPAPFGCMMLADLGAEVIVVQRPDPDPFYENLHSVLMRGRRRTVLDLKSADGVAAVLELVAGADVLVEGFRPGVAERLGIGPDPCLGVNPRLVYARMTGWGQDGPLARRAGHDINYLALSGALGSIGPGGSTPEPPLNLLGDFGAGGMLLVVGVLAAVHEARASGLGQVVDAAIVDGSVSLLAMLSAMQAAGLWSECRGTNVFDGGAPHYAVYECADGRFLALGALEPQFYAQLIAGLGLDPRQLPDRDDPDARAALRELFARTIGARTREHWVTVFEGSDACVTPVLTPEESRRDAHLGARRTWVDLDGVPQPAPAPRFSRTSTVPPAAAPGVEQQIRWTTRPAVG